MTRSILKALTLALGIAIAVPAAAQTADAALIQKARGIHDTPESVYSESCKTQERLTNPGHCIAVPRKSLLLQIWRTDE